MAIKRFTVPQTPQENIYFGSMAWRAHFDGQNVKFTNLKMSNHNEVILRNVKGGDMIGFSADGPNSKAFKVKRPIDEKYAILWQYGFTAPKRFTRNKGSYHYEWNPDENFPGFKEILERHFQDDWYRNQYGVLTIDYNLKYVTIRNANYKIMVATVSGRWERSNETIQEWYLDPEATLEDVKEWEKKYNKYAER